MSEQALTSLFERNDAAFLKYTPHVYFDCIKTEPYLSDEKLIYQQSRGSLRQATEM